jgi:hypothetical protein
LTSSEEKNEINDKNVGDDKGEDGIRTDYERCFIELN